MRDVKSKRILLIFTLLCIFFPTSAFGEEQTKVTGVGIGFSEGQPGPQPDNPTPNEPQPIDNVLPSALGQKSYYSQDTQLKDTFRGTLPKTGEQQKLLVQLIGVVCVASCFWLFLYTRLREEEEHG